MADIEHSELTGSALHEPKGIDAADADKVYVSDGVGSGTWQLVTNDNLADTGKAFQGQFVCCREIKNGAQNAGPLYQDTWNPRYMNNSTVNQIVGCSVIDRVTLPAGTYHIEARAPAYRVNGHMIAWKNITDGEYTLTGSSGFSDAVTGDVTYSHLTGRFTITASKIFELQHNCQVTKEINGAGIGVGRADPEVYSEVHIWRIDT